MGITVINAAINRHFKGVLSGVGNNSNMSHVTSYPTRSRDRLYDRYTVTATRLPPHGHRHTVTATRLPPYGYRHTATATRSPPHGHRHMATITRSPLHGHRYTAQPRAGLRVRLCAGLYNELCAGSCDKLCARLCIGTFNHRNLPKTFSPKALLAALGPLVPTVTPSL